MRATFLGGLDFAAGCTIDELAALNQLVEVRPFTKDQRILREGQVSSALFVVASGTVKIVKLGSSGLASDSNTFQITRLGPGSLIGEMSFLDGEPASASVVALEEGEMLVISREALENGGEVGRAILGKLTSNIALQLTKRLRAISGKHADTLKAEREHIRLREQFATFFIITMILFGIASTVQKLINAGLPPILQMLYSWGFLLLSFAPIAWFAWRMGAPLRQLGLNLQRWQQSLRESALVSFGLVAVMLAIRLATRQDGEPLVTWGSLASYGPGEFAIFFVAYGPHCLLQEFIGRGVIQGSLARFMPDSRPIVPILMTSALFGIFHFYVSVAFAVLTLVISLLFGEMYRRHGSLLGVTLTHYALGFSSIAFGFN